MKEMISTEANMTANLRTPIFRAENLEKIFTKTEDYRVGGLRMEHEEINGKHIFHNYGHGSSGFTLSAGTAFLMTKLFATHVVDRTVETAVIGAGINGLLTAIELAKIQVPVTIYADKIPTLGEKSPARMIGSQVCDGVWLPIGHDKSDVLKHELLTKLSFDYIRDCARAKKYQSIKTIDLFDRERTAKDFKKIIPAFLYNKYDNVKVNYGSGDMESFTKMNTFKIDTEKFVEELRVEAVLRGVKFVEQKFTSQEDVLALKQTSVFNCSGYSSKYLFNDEKVTGSTTHYVIFKNPQNLEYAMSVQIKEDLPVRIVCSGDSIIIKAETAEQNGEEFVRKLVAETQNFFAEKALKPKL